MKRSFARAVVAGLSALTVLCSSLPASAIDIGDILKKGALIVGGGAVVTAIAGPINDFINTVTFNKGAKFQGHTKVVPHRLVRKRHPYRGDPDWRTVPI